MRGNRRAWTVFLAVCLIAPGTATAAPPGGAGPAGLAVPTVEGPDNGPGRHLPDLVPIHAHQIRGGLSSVGATAGDVVVDTANRRDPFPAGRKAIRFATTIVNRGRHSAELLAVPTPMGNPREAVRTMLSQCVRFAGPRTSGSGRLCQEYAPVGSSAFHGYHGHVHLPGFVRYRLLRDRGGKPDTSAAGVLARSEPAGLCMRDAYWAGPGLMPVNTGWYQECRQTTVHGPAPVRHGISPQWVDHYGPGMPGQHLLIDKVRDGVYWIEIAVNRPEKPGQVKLLETNIANNTSYRRVQITHNGAHAKGL